MSTYVIKAFGVTKEILGARETVVEADGGTVRELRRALVERYPTLRDVRSLMIAVNNAYAEDDLSIDENARIRRSQPASAGMILIEFDAKYARPPGDVWRCGCVWRFHLPRKSDLWQIQDPRSGNRRKMRSEPFCLDIWTLYP